MLNKIEPTKKKLIINGEILEFIFDIDAFLELERRYGGNALVIFNQMLMRINITNNFTKILACACKNKEIDDKYLKKHLKINKQYLNFYTEITLDLMDGFIEDSVSNVNEGIDLLDEELEKVNIEEENKKKL